MELKALKKTNKQTQTISAKHCCCQTVYYQEPGLPSRRTHHMEQSGGKCDLFSGDLTSASENIYVPVLFPDIVIDNPQLISPPLVDSEVRK